MAHANRNLSTRSAQGLGLERGRELVARRLDSLLRSDIAGVLDSGWGPDEITRVVRRRAGATAANNHWRAHSRTWLPTDNSPG